MPNPAGMRAQPGAAARRGVPTLRSDQSRVKTLTNPGELIKEKTRQIWVHDLTGVPGKTYRYRLRVVMYNLLAGYRPILKDPKNNLRVGLVSDWSPPSEPVTLERESYFFVGQPTDTTGKTIQITVYKWHRGWLYTKAFTVGPNQAVGAKTKILMYQYQADGKMLETPNKEFNFDTGAVLQEISTNVPITVTESGGGTRQETGSIISVKMPDGTTIKQDTANISSDKDLKKCRGITMKQGQTLKKARTEGYLIREGRDDKESNNEKETPAR